MQEVKMLEIISRIKNLLERNCVYEAKIYTQLEIENLKGITQKKCKNTKYFFGNYCKYCSNMNCVSNIRKCV